MTYRQRTLQVKSGLRAAKKQYRTLDSALERVERELSRLIARKTLVGPESLQTLIKLWDQGVRPLYPKVEKALADAVSIASI